MLPIKKDIYSIVSFAVRFPVAARRLTLSKAEHHLIAYIAKEVKATEQPSRITNRSTVDTGIRREIIARRLTEIHVAAREFWLREGTI